MTKSQAIRNLAAIFGRTFALTQCGLCLAAGISYLVAGDIRRAVYWFAAATITASVTI